MTEEKLIHSMISDVFRITNEASSTKSKTPSYSSSKELPKTFLYEFCKDGKLFNVEDLDVVLYTRLSKQKEENKFKYISCPWSSLPTENLRFCKTCFRQNYPVAWKIEHGMAVPKKNGAK